jgi:DnaJ-class molecular chaperone
MFTFNERKEKRKSYYEEYVKGWKKRDCLACNGSGHYDHNGSPECRSCEGTGKERYKPQDT